MMKYRHIYGPVPSRRLGLSLGVDLFQSKTCNFNCVYCECGRNKRYIYERGSFVPVEEILAEIDDYLFSHPLPDSITFSGSGEPTLSLDIGTILEYLRLHYPAARLVVLTNGSLLWDKSVQEALLHAHCVVPSVDAVTEEAYRIIDRPHHAYPLQKVLHGIVEFSQRFHTQGGEIWVEVFLVPGVNDTREHTDQLALFLKEMMPDRVQLNTLDRPPAEPWVKPVGEETLLAVEKWLQEDGVHVPIDIVKRVGRRSEHQSYHRDVEASIIEVITRRPMQVDDLAVMLGISSQEVRVYLERLQQESKVVAVEENGGVFYRLR